MIHSPEECLKKASATNGVLLALKNKLSDPETVHLCETAIQLNNQLKGEFENVKTT